MTDRRRGTTLVEIVLYMALSGLVLAVTYALYVTGSRYFESTGAAFALGQDVEAGLRLLRMDLHDTSLASARTFPDRAQDSDLLPGLSLASCRNGSDLALAPTGHPLWTKHVLYTLKPGRPGHLTGDVVRMEAPLSSPAPFPVPGGHLPSRLLGTVPEKVVFRGVLLPEAMLDAAARKRRERVDQAMASVATGRPVIAPEAWEEGGFRVLFVRRNRSTGTQESLSSRNPRLFRGEDVVSNSGLLEVHLRFMPSSSAESRPTYQELRFRIAPRY